MRKLVSKFVLSIATAIIFVGCSKSESNKVDDANAKIRRMNEIASILDAKQVIFTTSSMQMPNMTASEIEYVEKLLVEYITLGEQVLAVASDPDVVFLESEKMSTQISIAQAQLSIVRSYKGQKLQQELSKVENDIKIEILLKEIQTILGEIPEVVKQEEAILQNMNIYFYKESSGQELTKNDLEALKGHMEKRLSLNNHAYDMLGTVIAKAEEAFRASSQSSRFDVIDFRAKLGGVVADAKSARLKIQKNKEEILKDLNTIKEELEKMTGQPVKLEVESNNFLPLISA